MKTQTKTKKSSSLGPRISHVVRSYHEPQFGAKALCGARVIGITAGPESVRCPKCEKIFSRGR